MPSLKHLIEKTKQFLNDQKVHDDHGWKHAEIVMNNADVACKHSYNLTNETKNRIKAAALLHDVDDPKIFYGEEYDGKKHQLKQAITTSNMHRDYLKFALDLLSEYVNAYNLMNACGFSMDFIVETIIMISKVSASKNGNSPVSYRYQAIPRDADRIEAIGEIGICRAYKYTKDTNMPLFTPDTVIVTNEKELKTHYADFKKRFEQYSKTKNVRSASMIDHFYDKLMWIDHIESGSHALYILAKSRMKVMKDWIFQVNTLRKIQSPEVTAQFIEDWTDTVCPKYFAQHRQTSPYKEKK